MSEFRKFCIGTFIGSAFHLMMDWAGALTDRAKDQPQASMLIVMLLFGLMAVAMFGDRR